MNRRVKKSYIFFPENISMPKILLINFGDGLRVHILKIQKLIINVVILPLNRGQLRSFINHKNHPLSTNKNSNIQTFLAIFNIHDHIAIMRNSFFTRIK